MRNAWSAGRARRWRSAWAAAGLGLALHGLAHGAPTGVFLEEMTSPELRSHIAAGATIAIVPVGGTEQNGAHMVLGKHNVRARLLAGRIAKQLGNAVVAPTLPFVPEGAVAPPQGHMRFAGTISITDATFEALLEEIARSLRQHGFRTVVFIGDHGGYQLDMEHVAARLNREWARRGGAARAIALRAYYDAAQKDYAQMLKAEGYGAAEIGEHAGLADTSLALALDPALVRADLLGREPQAGSGVRGDPRRATAALGQQGIDHIVDVSVKAIRDASASH